MSKTHINYPNKMQQNPLVQLNQMKMQFEKLAKSHAALVEDSKATKLAAQRMMEALVILLKGEDGTNEGYAFALDDLKSAREFIQSGGDINYHLDSTGLKLKLQPPETKAGVVP